MTVTTGSTWHVAAAQSDGWTSQGGQGGVPRIGVTLGDAAGIGPEVMLQALVHTNLQARNCVTVYVAAELEPWLRTACDRFGLLDEEPVARGPGLHLRAVPSAEPVHGESVPQPGKSTLESRAQAFRALVELADAAVAGNLDVMVTGPVPKGIFDHLTPRPPGQTEFLAGRLQAPRFAMMLAGPRLRVVPVTTHVPLRDVAGLLTTERIVNSGLAATDALVRWLGIASPRLAVCGLNPHAGEGGRLGDEEARIITPAVAELARQGIDVEGPLVADSVFYRAMTGRYDAVLCMYHDQALGPLKTVHFHDAYNLTCGLPVPRISADHGTAYDIAGKGIADPASMVQTLLRAERMAALTWSASGAGQG
jgi:4-hydroxythreonine-4-phosphate dehydrogenase